MAVSAVISRFPLMSVFTRCIGTPIRRANSSWLSSIGFKNSSIRISPGCVGFLFFGIISSISLVIINYLNIFCVPIYPFENNSKLIVDSDGMRTSPLAFQCFQVIRWRNTKIFQFVRSIQHIKFSDGDFPDSRWNPARLLCIASIENIFRALVDEVDNHIIIYHFNGIRASGFSTPARLTRRSS